MQAMRAQDGSPLPLACHLRGSEKLQSFFVIPYLYEYLLLLVLRDYLRLALE